MSIEAYFIFKCYKCSLGNFKPVKSLYQYVTTCCSEKNLKWDLEHHERMKHAHAQYGVYKKKTTQTKKKKKKKSLSSSFDVKNVMNKRACYI